MIRGVILAAQASVLYTGVGGGQCPVASLATGVVVSEHSIQRMFPKKYQGVIYYP
jgi:hypothetical protein